MHEVMVARETMGTQSDESPAVRDYAEIWPAADKAVYSRTLEAPSSAKTRIDREFDPETVRRMKATSERDITVGGPELAAQAIRSGLVDEYDVFIVPYVAGGGNRFLPKDVHMQLVLLNERRFGNGAIHLHYRTVR